jgi:hypothetical protein
MKEQQKVGNRQSTERERFSVDNPVREFDIISDL